MCWSHLNEDRYCLLFRLECTNILYGRSFYCQTFFSFFSLYLSNMIPLLLPRFCYAEILGLALFALWLRWSLYQSFIVFIVMAVFPHAHAELFIFSYFLSEYSVVDWYLCSSEILHHQCDLMFTWAPKNPPTKQEQTTLFFFLALITLDSSSQPHVFFRLLPSIEMP